MSALDEVALRVGVEDTAHGDFTAFYNVHQPRLIGSLVLYTGDRELAMDLAQETMARAYRDWRKVTRLESPSGWLHRVAFNLANSTFRRKLAERRFTAREKARADVGHQEPDTVAAMAVRKAVASIPERQKTALVLRYYADMSVTDVAEVMGCAEGTVRALTSQALATLRRSGLATDVEDDR